MNPAQYTEMVGLIETWWGPEAIGAWRDDANFQLFADLMPDQTYEALIALRDGGRYPDFPPKPPALRTLTLDLARHTPPPAISDSTERYDWEEWSTRTFGEVVPMTVAVERSAEAQALGVPTPSPQNPWRRESDEDAPDSRDPGGPHDLPPGSGLPPERPRPTPVVDNLPPL